MHVPSLHWIVADDNRVCNPMITQLLPRFGEYNEILLLPLLLYRMENKFGIHFFQGVLDTGFKILIFNPILVAGNNILSQAPF